jgi:cytidyltransferase-like protein
MTKVIVSSGLDRLDSHDFRFLQEAAKLGEVHVLLWSDQAVRKITGRPPRFSEAERAYVVRAVRSVTTLRLSDPEVNPDALPEGLPLRPDLWVMDDARPPAARQAFCARHGIACRVLAPVELAGFPEPAPEPPSDRKKVVVTGCYDFFHSGHVRFFEDVSDLGDLFVVVGNDENVRQLKGAGHPQFPAAERRFTVGAIRHVKQALVSTGMGWMDAAPEIARIQPDLYAVNEDGDRPEKREFCRRHGIDYVVRQRRPKAGLVRRTSTELRGF